jgi:hypothetical protein
MQETNHTAVERTGDGLQRFQGGVFSQTTLSPPGSMSAFTASCFWFRPAANRSFLILSPIAISLNVFNQWTKVKSFYKMLCIRYW